MLPDYASILCVNCRGTELFVHNRAAACDVTGPYFDATDLQIFKGRPNSAVLTF